MSFIFAKELKNKICWKGGSQIWDKFWQLKDLWKWWKILFVSPQKLFSFSRYLSFSPDFLVMYRNGLIKKISLISRSKDNYTMKFGQLIECNMRKTFLEQSYTKFGGETSPRAFPEKLKISISLNQWSITCFCCMACWGLSKYAETKLQTTCFHLILSFF